MSLKIFVFVKVDIYTKSVYNYRCEKYVCFWCIQMLDIQIKRFVIYFEYKELNGMFELKTNEEIGAYLKNLILSKYPSCRQFCVA